MAYCPLCGIGNEVALHLPLAARTEVTVSGWQLSEKAITRVGIHCKLINMKKTLLFSALIPAALLLSFTFQQKGFKKTGTNLYSISTTKSLAFPTGRPPGLQP